MISLNRLLLLTYSESLIRNDKDWTIIPRTDKITPQMHHVQQHELASH